MELSALLRKHRAPEVEIGDHPDYETRVELIHEIGRKRTSSDQQEQASAFLSEVDLLMTGFRDLANRVGACGLPGLVMGVPCKTRTGPPRIRAKKTRMNVTLGSESSLDK